jgi:hypothetical protein
MYKVTPTTKENTRTRETRKRVNIRFPALDAGPRNWFAESLGVSEFNEFDLNWSAFYGVKPYKTMTSFDVIEHLQNPLYYLFNIHTAMHKTGTLYLTTPAAWLFKGKHHFHEFTKAELLYCLKEAGFRDIKISRMRAYDLKFGIRPLIRWIRDILFGQCFFVEAKK